MQILENPQKCCGCGACFDACPVNAISMQEINGFMYPVINDSKCINCGKCKQICPIINTKYINFEKPLCYAVCANNIEREDSSSGGAFPVLAKYILNKGGVVVGAAFNEKWGCDHILIDSIDEIKKLKGSKYLQSNAYICYKDIKEKLNQGKTVLFSGTPCQNAGLKAFLGKDYKKLYCIDIICHGVPSPAIWQQFLSENFTDISSINFRDKEKGWNNFELSIYHNKNKKYSLIMTDDVYMMSFLTHLNLRKSCTSCPFNKIPRQGDLTIGDFWGVDASNPIFADDKGVSVVLVNNEKGQKLFSEIKEDFIVVEPKSLEKAIKNNPNLVSASNPHPSSDRFFDLVKKYKLKSVYNYIIKDKVDVLICNYWRYLNVGAMMTAYAIQQALNKLGFTNKLISYCHESGLNNIYDNSAFSRFEKKYLETTPFLKRQQLKSLNNSADNFIVGSDQIWNSDINLGDMTFFLDFVNNNKRKIACSASLGETGFSLDKTDFAFEKHYINQFDTISVREDESVKILKDTFNISASHILDPVFSLTSDDYSKLSQESLLSLPDEYIAMYSILPLDKLSNEINYLSDRYKAPIINININNSNLELEDWLKAIKNCKLLVTDSFHGICFALLFNKQFICVNMNNSSIRLLSLCRTFNISDYIWNFGEDIKNEDLHRPIDYQTINNRIAIERQKINDWLQDALYKDKENTFDNNVFLMNFLIDKINEQNIYIKDIKNKDIRKKIKKYKLMYHLSFGKKRKKYKNKYKELKKELIV